MMLSSKHLLTKLAESHRLDISIRHSLLIKKYFVMMISQVQYTKPLLQLLSARILTHASGDLHTLYNCRGLGRRNKCTLSGQEKTQHSVASKASLCIIYTVATSCLTGTVPRVPRSTSSPAGGRAEARTGPVVTCPVLLLALP